MKAAFSVVLLFLALTLIAGIALIVWDLHRDFGDVHTVLIQTGAAAAHLDQAIYKANTMVDTLNAAALEERANWQATSKEAAYTGRALRLLIARVDRSFVDGTLLHFNAVTLPGIDTQIARNGAQMAATLKQVGETADSLTTATNSLNAKLDDPQIPALLGHLNAISANLETVSANSAAMSADMKLAVHRIAQPPSKFHQFVSVAWTTARFGSLFVP